MQSAWFPSLSESEKNARKRENVTQHCNLSLTENEAVILAQKKESGQSDVTKRYRFSGGIFRHS